MWLEVFLKLKEYMYLRKSLDQKLLFNLCGHSQLHYDDNVGNLVKRCVHSHAFKSKLQAA